MSRRSRRTWAGECWRSRELRRLIIPSLTVDTTATNWSELRWQGRRLLAPNSSPKSSTAQHILGRISPGIPRITSDGKDREVQRYRKRTTMKIHWRSMSHHGLIAFQSSEGAKAVSVLATTTAGSAGKWLEMFTGLDSKVEVKSATRSRSPTSGSSAKWSMVKWWVLLEVCHRSPKKLTWFCNKENHIIDGWRVLQCLTLFEL